ncbi:hypothetical protein O988_06598 [Pseudogymnoascus sp. VKM F-3808]|nr:hypothetical protein O988_06598 [Pseudogymnoascus sp. VKM F-3808]
MTNMFSIINPMKSLLPEHLRRSNCGDRREELTGGTRHRFLNPKDQVKAKSKTTVQSNNQIRSNRFTMKFNTIGNTPIGVLLANTLAVSSLVASVVASPILIPGTALTSKKSCIFGSCGLGNRCRKENSCVGINLFDQDWSHCQTCACPSQVFGGRTDPTCVMDYDCLNVQLGNRPDPCAQTMRRAAPSPEIADHEASADPVLQSAAGVRGDGVIDPIDPNAKLPDFKKYLASTSQRSPIEPDDVGAAALERLRDSLPPSHVIRKRSELMDEFARLVDDGPSGPVAPDAAMMERLRSITHPEKRGGCYTVENGVAVEKRGGGGLREDDDSIGATVDIDLRKRGGCYTVENGVIVEKRGGCGSEELDAETNVEKRSGCFIKKDGVLYVDPDCGVPNHDFDGKRGGYSIVEKGE